MRDNRDEVIQQRLRELALMPSVSPFCKTLYQLIAEYAHPASSWDHGIDSLFARFLSIELRYHGQLARFSQRQDIRSGDLQSLTDKRQIGLELVAEEAHNTSCQSREEEIARQLILAECYYHTHKTDKVVAHLEAATEEDRDEPLIQFALGYNRYVLALQAFVRPAEQPGKRLTTSYLNFQIACLQAASTFAKVLTGSESDAEVYHWIGTVLATAGFPQAAEEAFAQAEAVEDGESDEVGLQDDGDLTSEFVSGQLPPGLPSITQAEIDEFTELLKDPPPIGDSWPDDYDINN